MTYTISGVSELGRTLDKMQDVLKNKFWEDVEVDLRENIKDGAKSHRDTGIMERNIYAKQITNGVEGGISDEGMMVNWVGVGRVNYATFVLKGSRAHAITPRNKKALRWVGSGGRFSFAKKVWHPGYIGDNFLEKAAEDTVSDLQRILDQNMKEAGVY